MFFEYFLGLVSREVSLSWRSRHNLIFSSYFLFSISKLTSVIKILPKGANFVSKFENIHEF